MGAFEAESLATPTAMATTLRTFTTVGDPVLDGDAGHMDGSAMQATEERTSLEAHRRGRGAAAEAAIVEAFREILAETGFARLRMEHVARRARVSKATLYRRWASKEELAAHLLREIGVQESAREEPFTSPVDDLLRHSQDGPVIRALICEIANNATVGDVYRAHVLARHRDAVRQVLGRRPRDPAASAGDVESEVDLILAQLYFDFFFAPTPEPIPSGVG